MSQNNITNEQIEKLGWKLIDIYWNYDNSAVFEKQGKRSKYELMYNPNNNDSWIKEHYNTQDGPGITKVFSGKLENMQAVEIITKAVVR